mmetsp:Transcript_15413/g.42336  ORF Transcript_15413/g.42336 Transcript_15413/m.42336 type:complete len:109 (+) Transcript_15413:1689-2015(+)
MLLFDLSPAVLLSEAAPAAGAEGTVGSVGTFLGDWSARVDRLAGESAAPAGGAGACSFAGAVVAAADVAAAAPPNHFPRAGWLRSLDPAPKLLLDRFVFGAIGPIRRA